MHVPKMVTERDAGNNTNEIRDMFETYLDDFCTTVTLRKNSITTDSMGRVTANTVSTSSIKGDIQFINKWNLDYINSGNVQIGDGMLFVKYDEEISLEDEVVFNGEYWHIIEQIEGEQILGSIISKGFLVRRNAQS